jgi:hypothetical protein
VLGREWIFVRMHDAVVRCLASMVALGHPIKPLMAVDSAAVSPRAAQVGAWEELGVHILVGAYVLE